MSQRHVVVIGNGISGTSFARALRKRSNHRITLISSESDYFFSRPAMMYVYMGQLREEQLKPYGDDFWEKNKIERKRALVQRIDPSTSLLHFDDGSSMVYDDLVIASGSERESVHWHGEHFGAIHGFVTLDDLQMITQQSDSIRKAVVIGGGLIGVELAEMFRSKNIQVTYLVREFQFWNRVLPDHESSMIEQHLVADHGVNLKMGVEVKEFKGDEEGNVRAVITTSGEEIDCDFAGICIGVKPRIGFLAESGIQCNKGILIDASFRTSVKNIYAIGDCAEFSPALAGRLAIEQNWYTGRMHGETLAEIISGSPLVYRPSNYFNSSKLFDIEFQVYSRETVLSDKLKSVFWENHAQRRCIRIYYDDSTLRFEGVSALGIRLRHEVCDRWLNENKSVEDVLTHLCDLNFDQEFALPFEQEVLDLYNRKSGKNLRLKKRDFKRIFQWR